VGKWSANIRVRTFRCQALVWNTGLLRAFYTQGAFFRNEHLVTEMMEQLELVLPLQFSLTMHFAEIDRVRLLLITFINIPINIPIYKYIYKYL
jgi:hypothetical protein